jgi:lysozyme
MMLGAAGRALIQGFESCKLVAFQDQGGIWTLGWGHTQGVTPGQTCTQEQADAWFIDDTQSACNAVTRTVDVPLNQNQFDALVSFTYNVGQGSEANSTLLKLLNQGKYALAADQFSFWNHVNGVPNAGLTRRRAAEQALFQTPVS